MLVAVPVGVRGVTSAYRVDGDPMSPAIRAGDVVCCGERKLEGDHWRELAVAEFPGFRFELVSRAIDGMLYAQKIKLIIKG